MQHYAITLPYDLIQAIAFGTKRIEVRTRVPKDLQPGSKIIVAQKKTDGQVRLQLRVKAVHHLDWLTGWSTFKDKIAVDYKWYIDYVHRRSSMFFVEFVYEGAFDDGVYLEEFGIIHAPQWFSVVRCTRRFITEH